MAVLTAATSPSAQGIIKVFTFSSVDDGDTFVGPANPKGYWASINGNPGTQASAGAAVTESSGTYTVYPGTSSLAGTLFVIV